ncbi:MAG: hypothetical protein QXR53_00635 [Candidatus Norongarragalinales archaeon]
MDSKLIAKYPFLAGAKELVGGEVSETDLKEAITFARDCFQHEEHVVKDASREAKSLLLSRIMLCSLGLGFLRKFAFLKAREYARLLEKEEGKVLVEIAKDFFPSLEKAEGGFRVSMVEYLQYGRSLPRANVLKGMVFFDEGELRACLREAIQERIADSEKLSSKLPENVSGAAQKLREFVPRDFTSQFKGKLLQRGELQNILKGVGEGKRYYGAMAVAIACLKDGLSRDEAADVMGSYVANCGKGAHPFTPREGDAVVDWVYAHPNIGFSFSVLKSQGLVD